MRLCTFERAGSVAVGVERDGEVFPTGYGEMLALIRDGAAGLDRARAVAERSAPVAVDRYLAPIPPAGDDLRLRRQLSDACRRGADDRHPD